MAHGHVVEFGSHDELMEKEDGRYKRLFESSKRGSTLESVGLSNSKGKEKGDKKEDEEEEEINWEEKINEEEDIKFDASRARGLASHESLYFFIGIIGAIFSGGGTYEIVGDHAHVYCVRGRNSCFPPYDVHSISNVGCPIFGDH